jgi:CRP-like cAMP-binding protein
MSTKKTSKIIDRRFVPAGQLVIEQGCIGNRAFLIERGKVEVFMRDRMGHTVKIAEVGAGSIIGEMALLDGGVRTASIRTLEDSTLIAISPQEIEESAGQPGGILQKMMKVMAERLKDTNDRLIRQNMELSDLHAVAHASVHNASTRIPEDRQDDFKRSMLPLLDKLRTTLERHQHV